MKYDDLKAKADAATPGPWRYQPNGDEDGELYSVEAPNAPSQRAGLDLTFAYTAHDAKYIAAAHPAAIKALVADYVKLRAALEEVVANDTCVCGSRNFCETLMEAIAKAREILKETE